MNSIFFILIGFVGSNLLWMVAVGINYKRFGRKLDSISADMDELGDVFSASYAPNNRVDVEYYPMQFVSPEQARRYFNSLRDDGLPKVADDLIP